MKFEEYVKMTKERGRDVTTVFKDRGVDLDLWHVCCPKQGICSVSVTFRRPFYYLVIGSDGGGDKLRRC